MPTTHTTFDLEMIESAAEGALALAVMCDASNVEPCGPACRSGLYAGVILDRGGDDWAHYSSHVGRGELRFEQVR